MSLSHDYLTIKQAAEYLQVTARTVFRYIEAGKLKASQPMGSNGSWRISASSVERLLEGK